MSNSSENRKKTVSRILQLIGNQKRYVVGTLLFAFLTVVTTLTIPILIGQGIDCIVGVDQVDVVNLKKIVLQIASVTIITTISQWCMNLCNNAITYRVANEVREQSFQKLQKVPLQYVDTQKHGDIVSRMISDVDQFADGLLMGFTQFFTGVMTIVGTLVFMFGINYKITFLVILITPLSLFVANFIAKKTYKMFQLQTKSKGENTSYINEMIGNLKVVKAFDYEEESSLKFKEYNETLEDYSMKATFFSSITFPATRFVNGVVYAAVGVFGAASVIRGQLSVGQLTSFLSYANQYTKPFNEISGVVTELQNALACAGRVFELIDEPTYLPDGEQAVELTQVDGTVEVEHIDFSYYPGQNLIEDLSISIQHGERVAIVGPTGCGKSTLINLLMRFYDVQSGTIYISGQEIDMIKRKSLRENFGMVLQETWLRSGTIRDNIAYGKEDATIEEIIEAAKEAHAHGFIERMKDGYDTILSENGGNLSQGEKQLLCIARVMLLLPPMLILDEATSSIDTRTEIKIQEAFGKMMKGRTSFVVAHRLSTIKNADKILVMRSGTIVEQGTHESLYDKKGFYYDLYQSQFAIIE
ncbi:MAG: ABC transporter ATP-binding protein [Eubacteriales bacterium]